MNDSNFVYKAKEEEKKEKTPEIKVPEVEIKDVYDIKYKDFTFYYPYGFKAQILNNYLTIRDNKKRYDIYITEGSINDYRENLAAFESLEAAKDAVITQDKTLTKNTAYTNNGRLYIIYKYKYGRESGYIYVTESLLPGVVMDEYDYSSPYSRFYSRYVYTIDMSSQYSGEGNYPNIWQ